MATLRQRVRAGIHFTLLNRMFVNGVPAAVALAAVRVVPMAEFGVFNVFLALGGLVGKMTSLGWPETIARYVPRLDEQGDRERLVGLLLRALGWRFIMTAALAATMVMGFGVLAPILKLQGSEGAFLLFAATVVFTTQNFLLTAAIESLLLQRVLFAIGVVSSVFQLTFIVVLLARGGSLVSLMWMELTRTFLFFVLAGFAVLRAAGGGLGWRALRQHRPFVDRGSIRYRWLSFLNDLSQELLSPRSDYLVLSYLASAVQVAVYAVPTRVIRFVDMVVPVTLLKATVESAFYRAYERDPSPIRLNGMFQTLTKINLTALGLILAVSLVHAHSAFVRAFGVQYQEAGTIFVIFIIVMALYYYPIGFVLRAIERIDLILWAKLSVVVYFGLAIVLVRFWGAVGMALATAAALLTKNLVVYWLTRRVGGVRMPWDAIGRIAVNVAATSILLLGLRVLTGDAWAGIAAGVAAGVLCYAALTFFNSGYSAAELGLFADVLPARIRRGRLVQLMFERMRQRVGATVQPAGVGPP